MGVWGACQARLETDYGQHVAMDMQGVLLGLTKGAHRLCFDRKDWQRVEACLALSWEQFAPWTKESHAVDEAALAGVWDNGADAEVKVEAVQAVEASEAAGEVVEDVDVGGWVCVGGGGGVGGGGRGGVGETTF